MFKRLLANRGKNAGHSAGADSEQDLLAKLDLTRLPVHVAIIMDGNGRWATWRGMPRSFGHRAGVKALRRVVELCVELQIKHLTVYAFSTENWKRPLEEVNILMDLLVEYLYKEIDELCANNVKINPIGILAELPEKARTAVYAARERSGANTGMVFNVALNYGGRAELVQAIRAIVGKVSEGRLRVEDIDGEVLAAHLYTAAQPDPDLLIRPSGDYRVSNFLLWQLAYTELWLTDTMWPDFSKQELLKAFLDFQSRERRFGGLVHK
ncbi:MAG: isoprenyl transferase [Firmicutes bacterium]|nr:isoprenyl transferase [Bacillota bacterium]